MRTTVTVVGMTCEHCEGRVSGELGEIIGVTDVVADHVSGLVQFSSNGRVDAADVRLAAEEAGYEIADA